MNAAEHLEQHLGQMEQGWSSASAPGLQVCLFRNQPAAGVNTLSTLGLSNLDLAMASGRSVRQELMITIPGDRSPDEFAKLMLHVAERLVRTGRALLRGDVVSLGSTIASDSSADALYASIPVVFPEALATLRDTSPQTVFVWLVPLLPTEVAFVQASGWSDFEDRLEAAEPDLFDLRREAVV